MVGERLVEMNIAAADITAANARPTTEEIDLACTAVTGSPVPPKAKEEGRAFFCTSGKGLYRMVARLRGQRNVPTCLEGGLCTEVRLCDTTHARTRSPRVSLAHLRTYDTALHHARIIGLRRFDCVCCGGEVGR